MEVKLRFMRPKEFATPPAFQRPLSPAFVKRLSDNFDVRFAGSILAWFTGHDYIPFDGQHRLEAAKAAGFDGLLPTLVYEDLSYEEVAEMFVTINRLRRSPTMVDVFRADIEAADPAALKLAYVLDKLGITVDGGGKDALKALEPVRALQQRGGIPVVEATLSAIKAMPPSEFGHVRYNGGLIKAIGSILVDFPDLDRKRFMAIIHHTSIDDILADIQQGLNTDSAGMRIRRSLIAAYNRRLTVKNRIGFPGRDFLAAS